MALRAGVAKYGKGRWNQIKCDPVLSRILTRRSREDLFERWRIITDDKYFESDDILQKYQEALIAHDEASVARRRAVQMELESFRIILQNTLLLDKMAGLQGHLMNESEIKNKVVAYQQYLEKIRSDQDSEASENILSVF